MRDDKHTPRKMFDGPRLDTLRLCSTPQLQRELKTQESVANPDPRRIAELKAELRPRNCQGCRLR
jgi:hypothetical protein